MILSDRMTRIHSRLGFSVLAVFTEFVFFPFAIALKNTLNPKFCLRVLNESVQEPRAVFSNTLTLACPLQS
ncbi:hypothetical protein BDR07DRAFT_1405436 [Suillus spraguei]|nr:hypothetical protein BDR07DRAFT_1405436 [Suillus spraguei]